MLEPFRLHEPATVAEASQLLGELGDDAAVYAGGTELLLAMKQGLLRRGHLVDVKKIGLNRIAFDEATGTLRIGATATHRSVERSDAVKTHFPMLAGMARRVANVRVRAVGTVGGNLCFAEPHSDVATCLLLYDAKGRLSGPLGGRIIPVNEFIVDGFTTSLGADELLVEVELPRLPAGAGASYVKFAFLERPSVGVGVVIIPTPDGRAVGEARIAVGCVGPKPFRAADAEATLRGAPLADGQFEDALRAAITPVVRQCDPIDDLYGSAEYKRHLVAVLVQRTANTAREATLRSSAHGS